MNYYHLECNFIEDEASFSIDEEFSDIGGLTDFSELAIRYYDQPPKVWVDQVYTQRRMSDVLKAIVYLPNSKVVDAFLSHFVSGVQFVPVSVDVDGAIYDDFYFMNVIAQYSLLNIGASGASGFSERKNGFNFIRKMVFSFDKLMKANIHHDIFRVQEYSQGIIVSERVKNILDKANITGLICFPVEVK